MLNTRTNQVRIFERRKNQWTTINRLQDREIEFEIIEFLSDKHRIYQNN